jgi:hypothetical protein
VLAAFEVDPGALVQVLVEDLGCFATADQKTTNARKGIRKETGYCPIVKWKNIFAMNDRTRPQSVWLSYLMSSDA